MDALAKLLDALSKFLWPGFAFYLLYLYQNEIRALLGRFRRGKVLGQEFELEPQPAPASLVLENIVDEIAELAEADAATPSSPTTPPAADNSVEKDSALTAVLRDRAAATDVVMARIEHQFGKIVMRDLTFPSSSGQKHIYDAAIGTNPLTLVDVHVNPTGMINAHTVAKATSRASEKFRDDFRTAEMKPYYMLVFAGRGPEHEGTIDQRIVKVHEGGTISIHYFDLSDMAWPSVS